MGGAKFFDDVWEHTPDGHNFFDEYSYDNTLALYESKQRPSTPSKQRPYLDKKIWDQLDLKSQLIIRGVAPEERERILALEKAKNMKPPPRSAHSVRFADAEQTDHSNSTLNFEEELQLLISKHSIQDRVNRDPNQASSPSSTHEPQPLIDRIANRHQQLPPHDIRRVMSTSHQRQPDTQEPPSNEDIESRLVNMNGHVYFRMDIHKTFYRVTTGVRQNPAALVDRGANGGFAGSDVRVLELSDRHADVSGIDDHTVKDVPIGTVVGLTKTQRGPVNLIMHQYAIYGKGKTIMSAPQMEHYGIKVDDKSVKIGGTQRLVTLEGFVIPLQFRDGLAYVEMSPPSDQDLQDYPHVVMTSDMEWNPSILDHEVDLNDIEQVMDGMPPANVYGDIRFDPQGNYRGIYGASAHDVTRVHQDGEPIHRTAAHTYEDDPTFFCDFVEDCVNEVRSSFRSQWKAKPPDIEALRPYMVWSTPAVVQHTLDNTTQWGRHVPHDTWKKTFKSQFPAFNVRRRNEAVATDTFYSDTPAVDSGATSAQIYVGLQSLYTSIYGMKSDKEFVNTLQDTIRKHGAMDKLISDRAQLEVSNKVLDILRNFYIGDWQSKPYYEHQNPAERRYQNVKHTANVVLDRTGAPAHTWLLCLLYVVFVLNCLSVESLGWKTPHQVLFGEMPDISELFQFEFWEPVYFATGEQLSYASSPSFPSATPEGKGRFVGFSETVGDKFTYKILTDDTQKIIYRSAVRTARDTSEINRRLSSPAGESKSIEIVKAPPRLPIDDSSADEDSTPRREQTFGKTFSAAELIDRTYLTEPDEKGQRFRAKIVEKIIERDRDKERGLQEIGVPKFLVRIEGDQPDQIVDYNDILNYVNAQLEDELDPDQVVWKFKGIVAHEGPLTKEHPSYRGSSYNVMVAWEDGSQTFEPLHIIAADDPVTCALYAKEQGLLDTPGWKRFKGIAKRDKKMIRMINQSKLRSYRRDPIYQYGYRVPRTPEEAIAIDKANNNTQWQDAMALEMAQLNEYETFKDLGKGSPGPVGYQKIRVHFVYAVKHDGRHKARLVAGGHLTETPIDSVYSGVVSLRSLRIVIFLAELNGLELWGADVGNAYLEAHTKEKVYIVAGKGFGALEGHTLVISKALYGLRSSGLRWHERFSDTLRDMGFEISKADPDVWMRKNGNVWEYIAVYVDDLAIAAKDPKSICDRLMKDYGYKLKGVGPLTFHLGCDFFRDKDGVLCFGPKKYIQKMMEAYEVMYGEKPKESGSPLEKNDHPELDESQVLESDGQKRYQSMIGALQWVISLGRFDVATPVMTMSRFRAEPRHGHKERLKRIYGYLRKFKDGAIRVRTGKPDYSDLEDVEYDWMYTTYGNVTEAVPLDLPEALGKSVVLTTYVDANLYHDLITGRAVTGILHLINSTPIDWYTKRQATVETATYGSEFVAARIATDQIIDLRLTLRYLGVPVETSTYLFGDNKSVVTSSTIPHSLLSKRHNALAYHRVREAIAAKILKFFHIEGTTNCADILSKHCGHAQLWPMVRPLLFWSGDTIKAHEEGWDESKSKAVTRVNPGDRVTAKPGAAKPQVENKFDKNTSDPPNEGECQRSRKVSRARCARPLVI